MKLVPNFGLSSVVLAAAVAPAGTFDVAYPLGTSQNTYTAGLAATGASMIVNGNDKYSGAQLSLSFGASLITVTNSSTVTLAAGSSVVVSAPYVTGNDTEVLSFPLDLASITGAQDVLTTFRPGVAGQIEDVTFAVDKPVTTAAKLAIISPFINAAAVTGGALALTSAAATPKGKIIQGSAVTALNSFTAADSISLKATGVTAFVEGSGVLLVRIRKTFPNMY